MGVGSLYLSLLLTVAVSTVHSHYVAVFPSTFRPGWEYRGQITVMNTQGGNSVTVRADIKDSRQNSIASNSGTVQNGEAMTLTINVPSIAPGGGSKYTLTLEGSGGLTFSNETDITLDMMTSITFVQTDKGIYKPSDLVRFRVVTVDRDLTPEQVARTITVKNPSGSSLAKFMDSGSKAVFEETFPVPDFPEFGEWMIHVESTENNIDVDFPFKVEEYVLPKFEVTATASPSYLIQGRKDTEVTLVISAKYTYGKGVMGEVKVTTPRQNLYAKITEASGVLEMTVDLAEDMKTEEAMTDSRGGLMMPPWPLPNRDIPLEIEVTSNKRTYSTSASVKVAQQPYTVEFDTKRSDNVYRKGTGPRLVVKVTDPVGGALGSDFQGNLLVTLKDYSKTVDAHSLFPITAGNMYYPHKFDPIHSDSYSLTAKAVLTDDKTGKKYNATMNLEKFRTMGNITLNLRTAEETKLPTMFENYAFIVDTYPGSDSFASLHYLVVSRGSVRREGSMQTSSGMFAVSMTPDLCPEVEVIAYGVTKVPAGTKGLPEIIADRASFSLSGCQEKELKPTSAQSSQKTGSEATLQMAIDWTDGQNSQAVGEHEVFLLAIDQSLLLLQGDGHDITPGRVDRGLGKFTLDPSSGGSGGGGPVIMDARPNIWPPPSAPSFTTSGELLRNSGLVLLMTGSLEDAPRYDDMIVMDGAAAGGGVMMRKNNDGGSAPDESASANVNPTPAKTTTVRQNFPDTWIWKSGQTDANGRMQLTEKLPDTITSWVISGFAVRENSDLVVTKNPFKLAAFNKFFVDLNLPYSIRRTEIFILTVTVFNYDPEMPEMKGMVSLKSSDDFIINNGDSKPFMVKYNSGASVDFNITAQTVKTINLTVTADEKSRRYTDIVTKSLIVKPEGEARSGVEVLPVVLTSSQPVFEKEVAINYTGGEVVPQSKRVTVKVSADMLANMMSDIDKLVQQPTGCGEQNMITVVPNIYAMKYLVAVQDTSPEFNETAKKYMTIGYRKELTYRWPGGGYSAFGKSDEAPSTWLTAFVVKSFAQAKPYIQDTVDLDVLKGDVNYTMFYWSSQLKMFVDRGRVLHDDMQGGAAGGEARTVYVTMCMIEAQKAGVPVTEEDQSKLAEAFNKVKEVAARLVTLASGNDMEAKGEEKNHFLAALTAYTLTLREPVDTQTVNTLIDFVATEAGPWKSGMEKPPAAGDRPGMYVRHQAGPSPIEITSYCVLAYLGMGSQGVAPARDLVMWLQTKQSSFGGYSSTQDTVLALQAISEYAAVFSKSADSTVELTPLEPASDPITITINNSNKRLLQTVQLSPDVTLLKVKITGASETFSLVKVIWDYNTMPKTDMDGLKVTTKTEVINDDLQMVEACLHPKEGLDYNNMMVMTIDSASCWAPDNIVETREENPGVKRVEQDQNLVHFYMESATNMCVKHRQTRQCQVENAQPGTVVAYAYYKAESLRAEADLMMVECKENCGSGPTGHAPGLTPLSSLLLTALICLMLSLLIAA